LAPTNPSTQDLLDGTDLVDNHDKIGTDCMSMDLKLSPNPQANLLAFLSLLAILGAVIVTIFASHREVAQYGPDALSINRDGEIYFNVASQIYKTDREGAILQ
jgi:hypothetical protein